MKTLLPKHLTKERLLKVATIAAMRVPRLYDCTELSLLDAIGRAAEMGLDFGGASGQAYIIPFKNSKLGVYEAKFVCGYKGMIDLAMRSGKVKSIFSQLVYRGEVEQKRFEIEYGTNRRLVHRPDPMAEHTDKDIVGAYAIADVEGVEPVFEWMTRKQIDAIRNRSRASGDGPWVTDYGQMARKTVIRRICNYIPQSAELIDLLERDQEFDDSPTRIQVDLDNVSTVGAEDAEEEAKPVSKADQIAKKIQGNTTQSGQQKVSGPESGTTTKRGRPAKTVSRPVDAGSGETVGNEVEPGDDEFGDDAPAEPVATTKTELFPEKPVTEAKKPVAPVEPPTDASALLESVLELVIAVADSGDEGKMNACLKSFSYWEGDGKVMEIDSLERLKKCGIKYLKYIWTNLRQEMDRRSAESEMGERFS